MAPVEPGVRLPLLGARDYGELVPGPGWTQPRGTGANDGVMHREDALRGRKGSVLDHLERLLSEDWTVDGASMGPRSAEVARLVLEEAVVNRKEWAVKSLVDLDETIEKIRAGRRLALPLDQADQLVEMILALMMQHVTDRKAQLVIAAKMRALTDRTIIDSTATVKEDSQ